MKRRKRKMTTLDYFRNNIKWFMLTMAVIFIAGIFIGPGFGSYGSLSCDGKPQQAESDFEDEVIAKVGTKDFMASEVAVATERQLRNIRAYNPNANLPPESYTQTQWYVLEELIKEHVLLENAKKDKDLDVSAEEVNDSYQQQKVSMMQNLGLLNPDQDTEASILELAHKGVEAQKAEKAFQSFLGQQGMTVTDIKNQIKDSLLIQAYNEKLNDEAQAEVDAEAEQRAKTIFQEIESDGSNMEEIANLEENDFASYSRTTDYTRKSAKSRSEDFSTTLFTAELNKVLEPMKVNNNWVILYIEDRVLAEGEDYENAKPGIIEELKEEKGILEEGEMPGQEEISEEKFQEMFETEGMEEDTGGETEADEPKEQITEDEIKERYEKVTYKQIQIRPDSTYTRTNDKIEQLKDEAGVEYLDPILKAYSYIAGFEAEDRNFEKAIEEFKAIRDTRKQEMVDAKAEFEAADQKAEAVSDDDPDKMRLLSEASVAEQRYLYSKDNLARTNYMIAYIMQQKLEELRSAREQDFFKLRQENPEEYADAQIPEPSAEEQAIIDQYEDEMYDLMTEAVDLVDPPVPHYSAMLAQMQFDREEWVKSYENWVDVIEYANLDVQLLRQADAVIDTLLREISDIDMDLREQASPVYDKLQENLSEATALEEEQRQRQQEMMQRMIQEQMETQTESGEE